METFTPKRVCVVGSGMAGLVAAYTLQKDTSSRFQVQVIEAVSSPASHLSTIYYPSPS